MLVSFVFFLCFLFLNSVNTHAYQRLMGPSNYCESHNDLRLIKGWNQIGHFPLRRALSFESGCASCNLIVVKFYIRIFPQVELFLLYQVLHRVMCQIFSCGGFLCFADPLMSEDFHPSLLLYWYQNFCYN